jgi:hypothetical protein
MNQRTVGLPLHICSSSASDRLLLGTLWEPLVDAGAIERGHASVRVHEIHYGDGVTTFLKVSR